MNLQSGLEVRLNWLFNHSLQAGLLVLLVLLVQWLFRRQLTHRWRFALWWIVLARLLLPFGPQSAVSLFNVFQPRVSLPAPTAAVSTPLSAAAPSREDLSVLANRPATAPAPAASGRPPQIPAGPAGSVVAPAAPRAASLDLTAWLIPGLTGLWLAGVLGLAAVVAAQWLRFHRRLAAAAPAGADLRALLEDCRREFRLSRRIELVETDAVQSPALFGLFRLRLLLPRGFGGQFGRRELRYIFLHELAHVQRGDLWLNWLVTALQILHWFNPLLWLGFARLRADRELACDELALVRAGDQAGTAYGETVVKLLESLTRPAAIPGLVGILEDREQMRRRVSMIANYRRPGRWSMLAAVLVLALALAALTDALNKKTADQPAHTQIHRPLTTHTGGLDLTGRVTGKGGAPLPGPAMVYIATAAPKTGGNTVGPTAWEDCAKHAPTDAQGAFTLKALDPTLTFQVVAAAEGYKPKYANKVDPAKGKPVTIELDPVEAADAPPAQTLRGRVFDTQGKPIVGADVEFVGLESKDGGGSYGMLAGIDREAVTDGEGAFLLTDKKPFDMMIVKVSARSYADKNFSQLASGTPHDLVMTPGAELHGRVVLNGRPLAGVSVGISAANRASGSFLGHFEIGTDPQGNFDFENLPPDGEFQLYTLMSSMKNQGAVPARQIHTGQDGETTDAGELAVEPAHRVAGRVVLADDQPVPAKTRLYLGRENGWDSLQVMLGQDGVFDLSGIPSEIIDLSARPKGYHASARNISLDQLNPFRLIGRVDHDITNLVFLMEKGPEIRPDYRHTDPDYNETRNRPLTGAEGGVDHSREWSVSGRVFDSDTKELVRNFRVTPGQVDEFNRTAWKTTYAADGTNGVYQTWFSKRAAQPLLKVEAQGYLPASLPLQPQECTNVDFVLKKGSGPSGAVVTAEGKPAAGATLVLLTDEFNQAGLSGSSGLTAYGDKSVEQTADEHGYFAFKPILGMSSLAAASADGFAVMSLEAFAARPTIRLVPFGKITGTLTRASGPGTNEQLDLLFGGDSSPGPSPINLSNSSITDSQGRFAFDQVPAGHLRITYRRLMDAINHGWVNEPLQEVDLKPGQTLAVNLTAADRPAPELRNTFQPPPEPKRLAGVQVKGVVLLPDGRPAADADVALQVENKYLALGRGAFDSSDRRNEGLIVSAGPDGSFTLPMYEGAQSVIALNLEGYARVSLDQLKQSPKIRLQKWARLEGALRVNHHPGTNEIVQLSSPRPRWSTMRRHLPGQANDLTATNSSPAALPPLIYNSSAFQAKTDEQGRFVLTFVPPGEELINRRIPLGAGSWTQSPLATVDVQPGETLVTNVGGTGRTVIGKIKFSGDAALDFKTAFARISTPTTKYMEKYNALKTDAERQAYAQSAEAEAAMKNYQNYGVVLQPDGSFRAEDVQPGAYELMLQPRMMHAPVSSEFKVYGSAQELVVAAAKDDNDDSVVDWGGVDLTARTIPVPSARAPVR
jgi:beta-lactamase regulating signal transducer with metallopeptidase domain/uncharacterized GH25 family protein